MSVPGGRCLVYLPPGVPIPLGIPVPLVYLLPCVYLPLVYTYPLAYLSPGIPIPWYTYPTGYNNLPEYTYLRIPIPVYLPSLKGPGKRDTHPLERTWDKGYPPYPL